MIKMNYNTIEEKKEKVRKSELRSKIRIILATGSFLFSVLIAYLFRNSNNETNIIPGVVFITFITILILLLAFSLYTEKFSNVEEEMVRNIKWLERHGFEYLGYELLDEDEVKISYALKDLKVQIKHFTYHFYKEFHFVENGEIDYELAYLILTNEKHLHMGNIEILTQHLKKTEKEKTENDFKEKVLEIWEK